MEPVSIHWRDLSALKTSVLSVSKVVLLICLIDFLISISLPVILSDKIFLDYYLNDNYTETVNRFNNGENTLSPNQASGWVSTPDYSQGRWQTDSIGARISTERESSAPNGVRIVLLGSSTMNGGSHLRAEDSIAGSLQKKGYSVWNFGTMLYSIDQSISNFDSRLKHLNADIIVLGIDNDYMAMSNMFVPFRMRDEIYIPFLKPIFVEHNGALKKISIDVNQQGNVSQLIDHFEYFKQYDSSYYKFEQYKYFGVMPITSNVLKVYNRLNQFLRAEGTYRNELKLQKLLLNNFAKKVETSGAKLIILKFFERQGRVDRLVQSIAPSFDEMQMDMLIDAGFDVISSRELREVSGELLANFYSSDNVHFRPDAYKIMAEVITDKISESYSKENSE